VSATPEIVTVPSQALKDFIKDAASIVSDALEVNPSACGDLQDRWLQAAGDLQRTIEDQKVPEEFPTGLGDCPAKSPCAYHFLCTNNKGHPGDHVAQGTDPIITWPQ